MFLKRLEISGFKSFAKKTTLDFFESGVFDNGKNIGITVIVGPNGSGKSNIADALRWAMGEQSMKNLRGKKAKDIIFAGSGSKSKLGSAQVSIFFDNKDNQIPLDFDEVVITRKIFRNGESEYLINGSRTRLIDIVDILARAGVGQRSYCIINQGMADNILNALPVERRSIIEEAAGVKEYQLKKERSQRKFKSTMRNIEQVENLLLEIEPHLRLLKRQSAKAQKGEVYRMRLKEKQHMLFGFFWERLMNAKTEAVEIKDDFGRKMMQVQMEVDKIIEKLKEESKNTVSLRDNIDVLERDQRKLNQELYSIERKIVVEEGKIELEKERAKNIQVVDVIPVGADTVKEHISEIRSRQDDLIRRIEWVKELSEIQGLKKYARAVAQKLYDLYEAVVRGRIEKKRPDKEIEKQETVNLKKIHQFQEALKTDKERKIKIERLLKKIKMKINEILEKDRSERKTSLELEDKLRREQFELDKLKDSFNEAKIEFVKIEVKEEDLTDRINNEMKISPEKLECKGKKIDAPKLENDINRLKFQLEQIGGIDESIIEEYDETQKRYDFLKKESNDLKEAMKKLKKVIHEMDNQIKDKFEDAYSFINKEFSKYFKIIFNGGKARIEKIEIKMLTRQVKEDNNGGTVEEFEENEKPETQIGIDIIAEPPGKKITNLGMLSGGERALTSLALLFAIISHNPPPFAFLDEVEAALDEANSKRFGKILAELSNQTQFVLVTHNRQTMREAMVLYGVTMGDDGVSKLLSIRLDQVGEEGDINDK
ncbi:MAG: AAA family ATPase [Patescibacteria group bacterium]|nr:AAA family ATPase [Patescibacteria group bacterium]